MKKLSNTEAELKQSVAYKKPVLHPLWVDIKAREYVDTGIKF